MGTKYMMLSVFNTEAKNEFYKMNNDLIKQLGLISVAKMVILLLIVIIVIGITMKVLNMKVPIRGKAIKNEVKNIDKIKKRDKDIIRKLKTISTITKIIELTPLRIDKSVVEYNNYNLYRANIRIPGKSRVMKAEEFNAIIRSIEVIGVLLGLIITVLVSMSIGALLILAVVIMTSTLPMMYVRGIVNERDLEIKDNFADLYLMIHYVLLTGASTPLINIIKSFDKTTNSEEMHRFTDICASNIDTYGEYEATRHIAKQYREVPEVTKLMRLIRQVNDGGDIRAELIGFRSEIINAKRYAIKQRMNKTTAKAKASFNILLPILIQAVISAMAIYFKDLSLTSAFF